VQQEVLTDVHSFNRALIHVLRTGPGRDCRGRDARSRGHCNGPDRSRNGTLGAGHHAFAQRFHTRSNASSAFSRGKRPAAGHYAVVQRATRNYFQDLLPAADRTRRVLAYELVVAQWGRAEFGSVRTQLHQLENMIQTGRKDGMVLMDNCLYDLYCKCVPSRTTPPSAGPITPTASSGKSPKPFEFFAVWRGANAAARLKLKGQKLNAGRESSALMNKISVGNTVHRASCNAISFPTRARVNVAAAPFWCGPQR